jgi:hypothetical protein
VNLMAEARAQCSCSLATLGSVICSCALASDGRGGIQMPRHRLVPASAVVMNARLFVMPTYSPIFVQAPPAMNGMLSLSSSPFT